MPGRPIGKDRVKRVARIYGSNQEAAAVLEVDPGPFSRLCRRYGIEPPAARHARLWRGAKDPRRHHPGAAARLQAAIDSDSFEDAARASGISPRTFCRHCIAERIELPPERAESDSSGRHVGKQGRPDATATQAAAI